MEVTLKAVNAPTVGRDGLPAYQEHPDGLCIRISITSTSPTALLPFDFARLRLQGAIKTQVGNRQSVDKFLNMTEDCCRSQFAPSSSSSNPATSTYRTTVVFDTANKPLSVASSLPNRPLPSTLVEASGFVTKHTALHDQHQVHGVCETHCWVTADFYRDGAVVHSSRAMIDPTCKPSLLSFEGDKSGRAGRRTSFTCRAPKPAFSAFRKAARDDPSALIELHEDSLIVKPSRTQDNIKCSTVHIPLNMTINGLLPNELASIEHEGGLVCEIETKWISQKSFYAGSNEAQHNDPMSLTKRTASTQISNVTFPPAYISESSAGTAAVSTVGMLQLVLPESASLPTLTSPLLRVDYSLEMKLRLRLHSGIVLSGKTHTQCILEG
jgi:hypothetical protein